MVHDEEVDAGPEPVVSSREAVVERSSEIHSPSMSARGPMPIPETSTTGHEHAAGDACWGDRELTIGVERTRLQVSPDTECLAKRFGALYDPHAGRWFYEGPIPEELMNLVYQPSPTFIVRSPGPVHARDVLARAEEPAKCKHHNPDLYRLVKLAVAVHQGSADRARRWFALPKVGLGMRPPKEFLSTPEDRLKVEELLLRLYD